MSSQDVVAPNERECRLVVVTGGPGSGKSTLLAALEKLRYARSIEAGRGIIQDQARIGGRALPCGNRELFAEMMLCWEMRSYHMAQHTEGVTFFDRGVPDVAGYLRLLELPEPEHVRNAAEMFRYHRQVFIAPPWREIFHPDEERKQDFEEAIHTYEALAAAYQAYDYELVELPRVSIDERVRFVLQKISL